MDYSTLRKVYPQLKDIELDASYDFGLDRYRSLQTKSVGVSGDIVSAASTIVDVDGDQTDFDVVLKMFRVKCPWNVLKHGARTLYRKRIVDDVSRHELGIGLLLTREILMSDKHITPHITWCFSALTYDGAYHLDNGVSKCDPRITYNSNTKIIVPATSLCDNNYDKWPQCSLRKDYDDGYSSDSIRVLVAEKCDGDLEQWIVNNSNLPIEEYDYRLGGMLVMIGYTMYALDKRFNGFVHGDFGPRNVLFKYITNNKKYMSYHIDDLDTTWKLDQSIGQIPVIWDFSNTVLGHIPRLEECFRYLGDDTITSNDLNEKYDNRPLLHDMHTLFNKVVELIPEDSQLKEILSNYCAVQYSSNMEAWSDFLTDPWVVDKYVNPENDNIADPVFEC